MTVCFSLIIPINSLTVLSSIAIAAGLYLFSAGFRLLARKRVLLSTPLTKIHSAAQGMVEVNGKAAGPYTMPAPITGKPCFLYRAIAWQQGERNRQQWEKVADETLHLPFFIEDSTGQLLVEPMGATLDLLRDFSEDYPSSFLSNSASFPASVNSFLTRHAIVPTRHIRVEEYLIKPDDPLFIAGTVTENPGVQLRPLTSQKIVDAAENEVPSLRPRNDDPLSAAPNNLGDPRVVPQVIRLAAGPAATVSLQMAQQAKIAAALTRAGITKAEAWSAAGVPHQSLVIQENAPSVTISQSVGMRLGGENHDGDSHQEQLTSSRFNLTPPVVLMKGANNPAFVISFRSQKEFIRALAWKSAAMLWGGAAIAIVGIYMFLAQMASRWFFAPVSY